METYEQKYKEALERARLLKLANPDDEAIQTFVKDSFPELRESEAEPEVDLEKILELVEKPLELFTERNLDRRKGYTNHDMQDAFILGFMAGIEGGSK